MKITVLSLFPQIIAQYCSVSMPNRIIADRDIELELIDIREYASGVHRHCDDKPFGGGAGMLMMTGPILRALDALPEKPNTLIIPSPDGRLFTHADAKYYARQSNITILAGHYEGIDARIKQLYTCDVLSIGDYVLSSGELASLVVIDAFLRLHTGALKEESTQEESFSIGKLEQDQYTRPAIIRNLRVPETLTSGNHKMIQKWKIANRNRKSKIYRPDVFS